MNTPINITRNRSYFLFTYESKDEEAIRHLVSLLKRYWDEVTEMEIAGDDVYQFELGSETVHDINEATYLIGMAVGSIFGYGEGNS